MTELLTLDQVAAKLGCSTKTVRRRIQDGLPVVDLGFRGGLRVRPEDLEQWIAERATRRREDLAVVAEVSRPVPGAARTRRRRPSHAGGRLVVTEDMGRAA